MVQLTKRVSKFTPKKFNVIDPRNCIRNTSFSYLITNGPNELECYPT